MKIKPLMKFSERQIKDAQNTVKAYRDSLGLPAQKLFDVEFQMFLKEGRNIEMDPTGLRQISYALKNISIELHKQYGKYFFRKKRHLLINIAHEIDYARLLLEREKKTKKELIV